MQQGRIYFDGDVFCWVRSGGLFSATHILSAIRKHFQVSVFIPADFVHESPSLQAQHGLAPHEVIPLPFTRRVLLALKLLGLRPPGLKLTDSDVIFHTNTDVYRGVARQICICHDLLPLTSEGFYSFRDRQITHLQLRRMQDPGVSVICHSHHVAGHVRCMAEVNGNRLVTVPLGLMSRPLGTSAPVRPALANRPVEVLSVSAYHPRKNFEALIAHVRRLNDDFGDIVRLTIAGPGLRARLASEEDAWVRVRDFVPENEYSQMFCSADIYVNPSAAEGFGITNLDAQGYSLPVLCNDLDVFHEILGDSAAYFDVQDYSSFARKILELIHDSEYRKSLTDSGFANVQRPTYGENIEDILIPWLLKSYGNSLLARGAAS